MAFDKAFIFLIHRNHGLLLLYKHKKSKSYYYEVPGGNVEREDFDAAARISESNSGYDDPICAARVCAARELYEETGIDLRDSLDRLKPVQLRATSGKFSCEYKGRIFFSVQTEDGDLSLQQNQEILASSLSKSMNDSPSDVMLKLSNEHEGFVFERNLSKAVDSLVLHSGGKVSAALSKASKNGQINRMMDEALQGEIRKEEGEQVKSPFQCNTIITRKLDISNCKESDPNDCHRIFHLYLPQILCDNYLNEAGVDLDSIGTLPLVFAVHCFGCSSQTVMSSFRQYANTHNMVIVAPEGLKSSFNGLDCCGYALSSKIDDVGFFSQIQSMLEGEYSFVKSGVSYATGWSNGGFMVMYAAKLFSAIAPISGYITDYPELTTDTTVGKGIFFHHSLDDPFVQSTGCCHDPDLPSCCCGIFAEQCVSVQDVMKNFAQEVNGCNIEDDGQSRSDVELEQSYQDEQMGVTCLTSTSSSCAANNTICVYEHSGHFNTDSFERSFPMAEQIMDFFARDACKTNGGLWSDQAKKCDCQDSGYDGTFCLDSSVGSAGVAESSEGVEVTTKMKAPSKEPPNHKITAGILLATVTGLCILKHRVNRRKQKDKDELDAETDEKVELVTRGLGLEQL